MLGVRRFNTVAILCLFSFVFSSFTLASDRPSKRKKEVTDCKTAVLKSEWKVNAEQTSALITAIDDVLEVSTQMRLLTLQLENNPKIQMAVYTKVAPKGRRTTMGTNSPIQSVTESILKIDKDSLAQLTDDGQQEDVLSPVLEQIFETKGQTLPDFSATMKQVFLSYISERIGDVYVSTPKSAKPAIVVITDDFTEAGELIPGRKNAIVLWANTQMFSTQPVDMSPRPDQPGYGIPRPVPQPGTPTPGRFRTMGSRGTIR